MMNQVLLFEYDFMLCEDRPLANQGCFYSISWRELNGIDFYIAELQPNGLYLCNGEVSPLEQLCEEQYRNHELSIEYEIFDRTEHIRETLLGFLRDDGRYTPRNRAWCEYWVLYFKAEEAARYEKKEKST